MNWPDDYIDKIICGDCLEVMKGIPDGAVDLVVTDPPYGVGVEYSSHNDNPYTLECLVNGMMPEFFRIAKIIAITCGIGNIYRYPEPTWILAWACPAGVGSGPWGFICWTPVLVYGKDPYLSNGLGRRPDTYFGSPTRELKIKHPVQKPLGFWSWLIERVSAASGGIVLDPFIGSGTTAVVCEQTGRHFIGIEIDPTYCEIARERVANTTPPLFTEEEML